jgi:hypothetical protein
LSEILGHPRYRLHILASRGRRLLRREHPLLTPLGYLGAFIGNGIRRRLMGQLLERSVFSAGRGALPFGSTDYPTQALALTSDNFHGVLQASCSIPFVLRSVSGIAGAPQGAYWDGGLTDYHLHLDYRSVCGGDGLVLYPHFQRSVVPGWLDKGLKWRHGATPFLDNVLLLAPDPQWVATLPHGKLPDRSDFTRYTGDLAGRVKAWTGAVSQAGQLADEFAAWSVKPDLLRVEPL